MALPVEIRGQVDVRTGLYLVEFVVPGIAEADAFDAGDAFGVAFELVVPPAGIISYGLFIDLDDEGTEIDAQLYSGPISVIASDAAFAPTDRDAMLYVTALKFSAFDDWGSFRTSEIRDHNAPYHAPLGKLHGQCKCVGTPNIAAGAAPVIRLGILPYKGSE